MSNNSHFIQQNNNIVLCHIEVIITKFNLIHKTRPWNYNDNNLQTNTHIVLYIAKVQTYYRLCITGNIQQFPVHPEYVK